MTVTRIHHEHRYVGLAADDKPTDEVPAGSRFVERDTGLEFIWDGAAWGQVVYPTALPE